MGSEPWSLDLVRAVIPLVPGRTQASLAGTAPRVKQSLRVGGENTFRYLCAQRLRGASDHRGTRGRVPGAALANSQQEGRERPIIGAGEEQPSRVGWHVLQTDSVCTVICFGYPRDGRNGANTG